MDRDRELEIARTIQVVRKKKGIAQRAIAEQLKMDPAAYNRIERGNGNLKASTLFKIAEALEVDPSVLLGRYSEEFNVLWERFNSLSPERQQRILEQLDDLEKLERLEKENP